MTDIHANAFGTGDNHQSDTETSTYNGDQNNGAAQGQTGDTGADAPAAAETPNTMPVANAPDAAALKAEMIKKAKAFGKHRAQGEDSLPFMGRMVFEGVLTGAITYTPPKAGKKGPGTVLSDVDQIWDAYSEGAATVKHAGDSLASQKSKLNAIAKWAHGNGAEWDQAEVLNQALAYRDKIVAQNAKAEGHKGRTKVHSVFQTMVNLAYRQCDEANKDARLSDELIEAAVLKTPSEGRSMRDDLEAFAKKAKGWYSGTGETGSAGYKPPVRTDEKMGALIKALDDLLVEFAEDDLRQKHEAMLAELREAGVLIDA